jgi:hypothetical protein
MFLESPYKQRFVELFCLSVVVASRRRLPSRTSISYDSGRLIGSAFSKTLMAVRSEKRVSRMGFENGKLLHFRCACHGRFPAQNRSILRNERPDTLNLGIKTIWLPSV